MSAGCPTGVSIAPSVGTFEVGDVLTCSADGYDTTYMWTGTAGVHGATVSKTGNVYTLPEGPFYLICTAIVSELSCRDSTTVSDTAYGMYRYLNRPNDIYEQNAVLLQGAPCDVAVNFGTCGSLQRHSVM